MPPCLNLAAACGQDVLDPIGARAVRQSYDIAIADRENIDWRLVTAARVPATVDDNTKAGDPRSNVLGDPVQPDLVPPAYDLRNRHDPPSPPAHPREHSIPGGVPVHHWARSPLAGQRQMRVFTPGAGDA